MNKTTTPPRPLPSNFYSWEDVAMGNTHHTASEETTTDKRGEGQEGGDGNRAAPQCNGTRDNCDFIVPSNMVAGSVLSFKVPEPLEVGLRFVVIEDRDTRVLTECISHRGHFSITPQMAYSKADMKLAICPQCNGTRERRENSPVAGSRATTEMIFTCKGCEVSK